MYRDAIDTVASLLDAALDAISELGYAAATTDEIARRAGVSEGALFHHFSTRRDLVVAAMQRHVAKTHERNEDFGAAVLKGDVADVVTKLLALARSAPPALWIEVLVATRTDDEFLAALSEALDRNLADARGLIERHPAFDALSPAARDVWFDLVRCFYLGEALWAMGGGFDDLDADTVDALAGLVDHLSDRAA